MFCFTVLRTCPFSSNQNRTCIILLVLNVDSDFKVVHLISSVGDGEITNTVATASRSGVRVRRLPGSSGFHNKLEIFKATLLSKKPY